MHPALRREDTFKHLSSETCFFACACVRRAAPVASVCGMKWMQSVVATTYSRLSPSPLLPLPQSPPLLLLLLLLLLLMMMQTTFSKTRANSCGLPTR